MIPRRITVVGAAGFVGRYVVKRLAAEGAVIAACCRHAHEAGYLRPMGDVGQVATFNADLADERAMAALVAGADAVVNAAGIIHEHGKQNFDAVHHQGPAQLARLAQAAGVKRFVHISAISADAAAPSRYSQSKAAGDAAVRAAFPAATILRPSLIFGPEDEFFNQFAAMARYLPALPLIGGGATKFQPVYVGDVAEAVVRVLGREDSAGQTYEIAGPVVLSLREMFEIMLGIIGRKRLLMTLPFGLASVEGLFMELLPKPPFTRDMVRMLKRDAIATPGAPGLAALGIVPETLEIVLPTYLERYRRAGRIAPRKALKA